MTYITPEKYHEICSVLPDKYLIPFKLTVQSGLRIHETGIIQKGKVKGRKPLNIYAFKDYSILEFQGKLVKIRKVETPFSVREIREWYFDRKAKPCYHSYENQIRKFGLTSHDGRRTFCINFLFLYKNLGLEAQLELIARTGHKSVRELEPYLREYIQLKPLLFENKQEIKQIMKHIVVLE